MVKDSFGVHLVVRVSDVVSDLVPDIASDLGRYPNLFTAFDVQVFAYACMDEYVGAWLRSMVLTIDDT